jgi:hypothetical protein
MNHRTAFLSREVGIGRIRDEKDAKDLKVLSIQRVMVA